jgi:hypothetical protein
MHARHLHIHTCTRIRTRTHDMSSDTSRRLLEEAKQLFESAPVAITPAAAAGASAAGAGFSTRLAIAVPAIAAVVAAGGAKDAVTADLCKAFIAHAAMLEIFPPDRRASSLPETLPATAHLAKLGEFLKGLWSPLRDALAALPVPADKNAAVAAECVLSDLWDGRFLTRLIVAASAAPSLGLPPATVATINKALAAAGVPGPLEPLCKGVAAADAAACKEVMAQCATQAAQLGAFSDEKIPRCVVCDTFGSHSSRVCQRREQGRYFV